MWVWEDRISTEKVAYQPFITEKMKQQVGGKDVGRDIIPWLQTIVEKPLLWLQYTTMDKLCHFGQESPSLESPQPLLYDRNNNNYIIFLTVIYLKKSPKKERPQHKIHRTSSKFNIYSLLGKLKLYKIENISFKMFLF